MPLSRSRLCKITILLLVLIQAGQLWAQRPKPYHLPYYDAAPYHFGFLLGYNRMNFTVNHAAGFSDSIYTEPFPDDLRPAPSSARIKSIEARADHGFNIGIVSDLHLGQYFNLRFTPTLSFGQRSLSYSIDTYQIGIVTPTYVEIEKPDILITFVDFPLYLKYKSARYNNMRSYIIGGVKYALDLTSKEKRGDFLKLYRNDLYFDLGTGFDFYTEYFKFGVEMKMSYGLRNLINRNANPNVLIYIQSIEDLRSKIFMLSFTFE